MGDEDRGAAWQQRLCSSRTVANVSKFPPAHERGPSAGAVAAVLVDRQASEEPTAFTSLRPLLPQRARRRACTNCRVNRQNGGDNHNGLALPEFTSSSIKDRAGIERDREAIGGLTSHRNMSPRFHAEFTTPISEKVRAHERSRQAW